MKAFKKQGGGFLNDVDATLIAYKYTDTFNGEPFKAGKTDKGKDRFHSLYCVLTTRVEGAVETADTHLFMGGFEDWDVAEDGQTLIQLDEANPRILGEGTAFSVFLLSAIAADPRIAGLLGDEDDTSYDLRALMGTRVHFAQEVDAAATKKLGQVVSKKTGKPTYDRKNLVVEAVLELPARTAKVAPGATKAKTKGKGAAAASDASEPDLEALAVATLETILTASGGTIERTKLNMALLKTLLKSKELSQEVREAVRQRAFSVDFLESVEGVVYDATSGIIEKVVGVAS